MTRTTEITKSAFLLLKSFKNFKISLVDLKGDVQGKDVRLSIDILLSS